MIVFSVDSFSALDGVVVVADRPTLLNKSVQKRYVNLLNESVRTDDFHYKQYFGITHYGITTH